MRRTRDVLAEESYSSHANVRKSRFKTTLHHKRQSVNIIKLKFDKRKLEVKSYIPNNTVSKHMNSFIISWFIIIILTVYRSIHLHVGVCTWAGSRGQSHLIPLAGVPDGCELLNVGAGNWLWKGIGYSSSLRHLSSSKLFIITAFIVTNTRENACISSFLFSPLFQWDGTIGSQGRCSNFAPSWKHPLGYT